MFLKGIIIAAISLGLDQLHKYYMIYHVKIYQQAIEVTEFFNLVMVWNRGISFGMFSDNQYSQYIFSAIAIIITIILLIWLKRTKTFLQSCALGLIIGGALGNIIDRIRFGAVADFFDFHIAGYHWPAFNIADMVVFIGVALIIIESIFYTNDEENKDE